MASVDGVYVGPIDLDEVPELVEQIRAGRDVLPDKQLVKRRSVDPTAAGVPGNTPTAPTAAGAPMGGVEGTDGPVAPYEQADDPPEGPEPRQ
jgi:hypothetical protein